MSRPPLPPRTCKKCGDKSRVGKRVMKANICAWCIENAPLAVREYHRTREAA